MTSTLPEAILASEDPPSGRPRVAQATVAGAMQAGSEVALVDAARRGDPAAFDRLAGARIDRAYRLALAIVRSEADARDAVQEAFVAAWRELPRLRDAQRFDPWLDRILVNACRMALRHRKVVRVREIHVVDPPDEAPPAADRAPAFDDRVADVDLVRRALGRLDPDRRTLLVLHHLDGRSVDEIAAILGIPSGTVKWRLHAARAALEQALAEESR